MALRFVAFACFLGSVLPAQTGPGSALLIHSDAECSVSVDGRSRGTVTPGGELQLNLPAGEHQVEAVSPPETKKWKKTVVVSSIPQQLLIPWSAVRNYWTDPQTRLIWTAADNGSGLTWSQAIRFCRELELSGYTDWVLPAIDDLQGIFQRSSSESGFHVRAPIHLTGWQWSSSPGLQGGEGWALDFGDGGRASVSAGDSGLNRALCVRRAQKGASDIEKQVGISRPAYRNSLLGGGLANKASFRRIGD